MAVIYMPPNQNNFGGALGAGVGQGVSIFAEHQLKMQEQAQIMARQQQAMMAVKNAKSREEALGILTMPGAVNSPQELANAMKFVDALHPPKDETPTLVSGFTPGGDKVDRFVKKSELPQLNDPNAVHGLFGDNVSLTEPKNLVDFFSSGGQELGKGNLANRPEGAMTKEELTLANKKAADARSEAHLKISEKTAARGAEAAVRSADAAQRGNERLDMEKQRTAVRMLQDSINVKKVVGANGELTLDWSGEADSKKMKAYHAALGDLDSAIQRNKGNVAKAVADLQQKYFPDEEDKPEPPKPKVDPAPEPSKARKIINDIGATIKKAVGAKPKDDLGKQDGAYVVASQRDYDKLESGDEYIWNGKRLRKK